jgi:hypothetical protein
MRNITIEKIDNGYLVRGGSLVDKTRHCADAQILFEELLMTLEGRSRSFGGESYGAVFVANEPGKTFTAPAEHVPV